jgi:hypothetical protein
MTSRRENQWWTAKFSEGATGLVGPRTVAGHFQPPYLVCQLPHVSESRRQGASHDVHQ